MPIGRGLVMMFGAFELWEDIEREIATLWIRDEINDITYEGMFLDENGHLEINDAEITIVLAEDEPHYPLVLNGRTKAGPGCNDYDEHCRYCKKKACKTWECVGWKGTFIRRTKNTLTYLVEGN